MQINTDLHRFVAINTHDLDWNPSPVKGVVRKPLYRQGGEVAKATSLVEYAPQSRFTHHSHPGGEEIVVLDGVFSDEHGDYPAGSYIRNPPGSSHSPRSDEGCTIFVKLWQFSRSDLKPVVTTIPSLPLDLTQCVTLFENTYEHVALLQLTPGTTWSFSNHPGLEILVLKGAVAANKIKLNANAWLRAPSSVAVDLNTKEIPALLWIKLAPLVFADNIPLHQGKS